MPRYFFHLIEGDHRVPDEEGATLDGPEAARRFALTGAQSIISEGAKQGLIDLDGRMEVTDGTGEPVLEVRFDEAVRFKPAPARGGRLQLGGPAEGA